MPVPAARISLDQSHRLMAAGACTDGLAFAKRAYAEAVAAKDGDGIALSLGQLAWCCMRLGEVETGLECVTAARRLLHDGGDPAQLSRLAGIEAFLLLDLGLSDDAFDMADRAVELATEAGDRAALAFALNAKGCVLAICRQMTMALPLLQHSIEAATAADELNLRAFGLLNLGFCYAKLADASQAADDAATARHWLDLACEITDEAIAAAELCGDLWILRTALTNGAEFHAQCDTLDTALAYLDRCAALPGDPGTSLAIHYLYTLGHVLLQAGDLTRARASCEGALALAEASHQIDHQLNALHQLCLIHEAMGDVSTALGLHKRYHALYVHQSGETTQRRARAAEIRFENQQLRARADTLAGQALLDPLTGIANRRSFDQIIAGLADSPYALAILDLDRFKQVNDRFSHVVGDAVLQRVAALLQSSLGTFGTAARLGGEEFALVFLHLDTSAAAAQAQDVLAAIRLADWSDLTPGLGITASIGLASTIDTPERATLMLHADRRLYAAKAQGRDRVVWHDDDALQQARL